ncbi:MAG TPA: hypothetical protein ENI87_15325 [bacterium]|nr:hypothetical protein [bacterium]
MHTVEENLAAAAASSAGESTAVLECNGNRARFVLSTDGTPVRVRRFMVGTASEPNPSMLMTQLAMEMPRTFDWLRDSGQEAPERLLVGLRVGIEEESLAMLAGDDKTTVARAESPVIVADGQASPSLGAAWLLDRVCAGRAPGSLSQTPKLRMPIGTGGMLAMAASTVIAVGAGYWAFDEGSTWLEIRKQRLAVQDEVDALSQQLADLRMADMDAAASTVEPMLEEALRMRRPVSRLIADVSNAATPFIHIAEVRFASQGPVVVAGQVDGGDRDGVLAAMSSFSGRLRRLPYVESLQEEVEEVPGMRDRLRFKLSLTWRKR